MVIRSVNLETVCGITSKIPDNPFNEVAFAGKSNVGKSSMEQMKIVYTLIYTYPVRQNF